MQSDQGNFQGTIQPELLDNKKFGIEFLLEEIEKKGNVIKIKTHSCKK